jgi:acyl dehydratase
MRHIASVDELRSLIGQEVAVTDWMEISQQQVNMFAEATGDHQWIHLDVERCKTESPYRTTVAHGFLTLSLLPVLMQSAISMPPSKLSVNYGLNKVRFPAPVPVGSRVRARVVPLEVEDIEGGYQMTWKVTIEREGGDKPVCVAESMARRYE